MDPFVTVIIPTFNEEKHIASLLENIIHQDYPGERLEVFIIDGMSNDRTNPNSEGPNSDPSSVARPP